MLSERGHGLVGLLCLALVTAGLTWPAPPQAQNTPPGRGPCVEDAQKFCPNVKTPQERAACFTRHEAELSPACKAGREATRTKIIEFKECQEDAERLCSTVTPG